MTIPNILAVTEGNGAFGVLDIILFCVAVVGVIFLGIWKSRDESHEGEKSASDYFLAGRGLTWWLVGFSLIAANISTEQFVGMSGQSADWLGMAIASYEWIAAFGLIIVAFFFLPKLLRCGIYTIPEFLEYRYGVLARSFMAVATMLILVGVPTASVIYSGAKVVSVFFAGYSLLGIDCGDLTVGCVIIGLSAAIYVYVGGLKACAWTDLIWGASLIVGGGVIMYLAFDVIGSADPTELIKAKVATSQATVDTLREAGSVDRFLQLNSGPAVDGANLAGGKLHMIRPATDPQIPWTIFLMGIWIPNLFYWGLNQYIMQRTLGSKSLDEGQKGIVFAAFLKLIIPFIVVIPGILAFNLYNSDMKELAVKKNEAQIELINKGEAKYFPISNDFAMANSEQALQALVHNAKIAGTSTEGMSIEQALVAIDPIALSKESEESPEAEKPATLIESFTLIQSDADSGSKLSASTNIANANANIIANHAKTVDGTPIGQGTKLVAYDYDGAFPTLLSRLLKPGLSWFVLAAIFGAVVSSLASMLNSASTIFTMDIYHKLRKTAKPTELVRVGKIGVLVCVLIALSIAPSLGHPSFGGIFTFIQEFQGFISSGILAVFLFAFFMPRTPRYFGWLGILLNVVFYGALKWCPLTADIAFLNRMAICFVIIIGIGMLITLVAPLSEPVVLPDKGVVDTKSSSNTTKMLGVGVCLLTVLLYIIFW